MDMNALWQELQEDEVSLVQIDPEDRFAVGRLSMEIRDTMAERGMIVDTEIDGNQLLVHNLWS
jgi:hypothetical protein